MLIIVLSFATGGEAAAAAAPHVAAVQLGIKLLVAVFEADNSVREGLLRELQGRLVGVKEEVAQPFVAVLGLLVQRHPRAVLEHANLLKVSTSHRVLHALVLINNYNSLPKCKLQQVVVKPCRSCEKQVLVETRSQALQTLNPKQFLNPKSVCNFDQLQSHARAALHIQDVIPDS